MVILLASVIAATSMGGTVYAAKEQGELTEKITNETTGMMTDPITTSPKRKIQSLQNHPIQFV